MNKKNILIYDFYNMVFRNLYVAESHGKRDFLTQMEVFSYWRHLLMNSLMAPIHKGDYDEIIIAYDNKNYWRNDIYPEYKAQRKKARDDSTIDFDAFFVEFDEFINEFMELYPVFKHVRVDRCEADDIIAVISKYHSGLGNNVIIYTSDGDFKQLLKYKNITVYNPIKKKNMTSLNPDKELKIKCIMGDKGDNIFAIKNRCGIKTAEKILNDPNFTLMMLDYYSENNENKESKLTEEELDMAKKYELNQNLINFDNIPVYIKNNIMKEYESLTIEKIKEGKIINWMNEKGMNTHASTFLRQGAKPLNKLFRKYKKRLDQELTNQLF
jgi:5'-3' exonuclease